MRAPEKFRLKNHPTLGSDASYGCNGFFVIPHHKIIGYYYNCMISDGMGWQHVSITLTKDKRILTGNGKPTGKVVVETVERCPNWEEMCFIKDIFWSKDEAVMQIHPPERDYVSNHHYCLHLWKPDVGFPLPEAIMVGTPSKQIHV